MTGDAVVYCDVDRNKVQWFWVIPVDDSSSMPQVHGPFRSEAAARRDAKMFTERHVPVPAETARFAAGVLGSIASDWLRNSDYYERQEPSVENKRRAAMAKSNHTELRRHIDELESAVTTIKTGIDE